MSETDLFAKGKYKHICLLWLAVTQTNNNTSGCHFILDIYQTRLLQFCSSEMLCTWSSWSTRLPPHCSNDKW